MLAKNGTTIGIGSGQPSRIDSCEIAINKLKKFQNLNDNIVGIDASILMHPITWKASGHVDAFNDPLIDNKDSKKRSCETSNRNGYI